MISTVLSKERAERKSKVTASRIRTIVSAGVILFVFSQKKSPRYLLLQSKSGVWGFPKGKRERGESHIETAVRETREETGIHNFFLVSGFQKRYAFTFGKKFTKTVFLYAALARGGRVRLSREYVNFSWFSYDEALKHIAFPAIRAIIESLHGHLLKQRKLFILQERVCRIVARVPRGTVISYRDVAHAAGSDVTPRLVGLFMSLNYDTGVPCHRVVSHNGSIGGYNRGVEEKIRLLKKEGVAVGGKGRDARIIGRN